MELAALPITIEIIDQGINPDKKQAETYAKITAIRIQDIARQKWYSWDDPTRVWSAIPQVMPLENNLYIALYVTNTKATTQTITISITSTIKGEILATKQVDVNAGASIALEYTGDFNPTRFLLTLKAEFTKELPIPPKEEPTPTPTPEMPAMPVVEIPDLPWYASWLTPVIQYISSFGTAVINYLPNILPIRQGFEAIINLPKAFLDGITGNLDKIVEDASTASMKRSTDVLKDIAVGSSLFMSPLEKEVNRLINRARGEPENVILVDMETLKKYAPDRAFTRLQADSNRLGANLVTIDAAGVAAEVATLGQVETVLDAGRAAQTRMGAEDIVKARYMLAYNKMVLKPAEYYLNSYLTPELPSSSQLIEMAVKEVITVDTFKHYMLYEGFDADWSQKIWDAHFIQPDYGSIRQAIWFGSIPQDKIDQYLKLVDLDPRYNDTVWKPLLEQIPSVSELVNERVKEVTTQVEFEESLSFWGFKGKWAKRIWDAHFTPAGFMDFLTAMRRKKTVSIPVAEGSPVQHTFGLDAARDIDAIKQLSELADYDPRYWDFFETRIYGDPSPRMSMWAYETGTVTEPQLRETVHRYGYTPDTEKWFGDMLIHFQERPWVTKYITALATAYIGEVITGDELKKRIIAIPRNENVADWIIKVADVRKEIIASKKVIAEPKLLSVADLKSLYALGKISEDKLRTELQLRGYAIDDVQLLIEVINASKEVADVGGAKVALSVTEMLQAFRYNEVTEQWLSTQLQLKGMALDEITILINTKKKMWAMGGQEVSG